MLLFSTSLRATGRLLCCSKTSPTLSTPRSTSSAVRPGVISEGEREQRLLRAAVLGLPNAGKTTLVNQLLGRKVCSSHTTSRHTTHADFVESTLKIIAKTLHTPTATDT